jgi:hypothetical protein
MPFIPEMEEFVPNDVLADLYANIYTLFSAGDPLADVYLEAPERIDTDLNSTSFLIIRFLSEQPLTDGVCGYDNMWDGIKKIHTEVIIVSRDRYEAQRVWAKLENYLHQGQFSFTMLTPVGVSSPLYYVIYGGVRAYHVESEGYGLQVDLVIQTYRNFEVIP